jgi:hypothetical protein
MQPSVNSEIHELLLQWESIRHISCPTGDSMHEAIVHECAKNLVDSYAQDLRTSRLENNSLNEVHYTAKFVESYYNFTKDFVFRILKNGKTRT